MKYDYTDLKQQFVERDVTTDVKALSRNKQTQKHLRCEKILQVAGRFVYNEQ